MSAPDQHPPPLSPPTRLADHIDFPVSEARLEGQWQVVRERAAKPRGGFSWLWAGGGLAAAAVIALGVWIALEGVSPSGTEPVAFDGAQLESGADEVQVALRDGTEIVLDPQSHIELARQEPLDVRLDVRRGRARFDVPHVEGRSFVVRSRGVDVVVVGTRFSVGVSGSGATDPERVVVAVEEGTVEVRRDGEAPRRVTAGEELRLSVEEEPTAADDGHAAADPVEEPEAVEVEPAPARRRPARIAAPDPSELWAEATAARRAGQAAEAAERYATFLRVAPRDSQAALASFELARLRMDALGDPGGAVPPLRRALSMAPRAPWAEDAAARLVDATDRAGRQAQCRAAREQYLARYPSGVHRARVEARCPSAAPQP